MHIKNSYTRQREVILHCNFPAVTWNCHYCETRQCYRNRCELSEYSPVVAVIFTDSSCCRYFGGGRWKAGIGTVSFPSTLPQAIQLQVHYNSHQMLLLYKSYPYLLSQTSLQRLP